MTARASLIVPLILAFASGLAGVARADDDSPAYTIEDVTACSADAMRLCKSKMPDIDAIEGCMKAHYSELRPKCKARFDKDR